MKDRIVMHLDMNAFFASVEQRCDPGLRGKPVAVVGSAVRTVITTASYEAREFGVKTGMNMYEAKRLCPSIIFVVGDSDKYIDASIRMMAVLKQFSPLVEPYSIDEAFLDISGSLALFGSPVELAAKVKRLIRDSLGLTCSIGIAPNKLLAKLASDMQKPDGLVLIDAADVAAALERLPVKELCGIGPSIDAGLAGLGIRTCGELGRAPLSMLKKRFGIIGERLRLMGQGADDSPVVAAGEEAATKSIGHSMTLPKDMSDKVSIKRELLKLSEMVGSRARRHAFKGRCLTLVIRYSDFYTFSTRKSFAVAVNDTREIYALVSALADAIRLKGAVRLLGVSISSLVKDDMQLPLFEEERKRESLLRAVDAVNDSFGSRTLTWAALFERPERDAFVISPAWRADGVRRV